MLLNWPLMANYFACLWVSQLYVKTITLRIPPPHCPEPLSSQSFNPDSFPAPCQTLKCHSTWFLCFQQFPKQTVEAETSWVFTQSDATVSPNLSCLSRHWRQVRSLRGPCLSISALCHVLESGSWGLMVRTCPLGGRRPQREGGLDSKGLWLQFDLPFLSSYSKKNMYVYIKNYTHTFFFEYWSRNCFPDLGIIFAFSRSSVPCTLPPSPSLTQLRLKLCSAHSLRPPPGMALSSRAHAFSVEALVGTPSKRKLQEPREEVQLELLEKEGGKVQEERRSGAAGKKREQPGKYFYGTPKP